MRRRGRREKVWERGGSEETDKFWMRNKQGQLVNDATSSVYDKYLRWILSVACLLNHLSAFLIGWGKES